MNNWNEVTAGFQRKTINKIINNKIDTWLKTIRPYPDDKQNNEFRNKAKEGIIVTGGAIVNLLVGLTPNDYDIYFSNADVGLEVVNYYLKDLKPKATLGSKVSAIHAIKTNNDKQIQIYIKSSGIAGAEDPNEGYDYFEVTNQDPTQYFDKQLFKSNLRRSKKNPNHYLMLMATDNAISLSDDIQIITRFVGNPEEIHENFDFEHTKSYWTAKTGVVINPNSLELIMSRTLRYTGSKYPLCSMFRLRKFLTRGWSINAGEMLKIGWDINDLNLGDLNVLREQLIGVDSNYFLQLITLMKNETKPEVIDRSYIINLIDRVFSSDLIANEENIVDSVLNDED